MWSLRALSIVSKTTGFDSTKGGGCSNTDDGGCSAYGSVQTMVNGLYPLTNICGSKHDHWKLVIEKGGTVLAAPAARRSITFPQSFANTASANEVC